LVEWLACTRVEVTSNTMTAVKATPYNFEDHL